MLETILALTTLAGLAASLYFAQRWRGETAAREAERGEADAARQERARLETLLAERSEALAAARTEIEAARVRILEESNRIAALRQENTDLASRMKETREEAEERRRVLLQEFENLSAKVMERQSEKFTAVQAEKVGNLLNPLGEKIVEFQKSVKELGDKGRDQHVELKTQLEALHRNSATMTEEARNLTQALRGQKAQGNWGEVVLARVLELSGLTEGQEFRTQVSETDAEGRRKQPDVIVDLPEGRNLVIDAKVSLTAYTRSISAGTEEEREACLREHVTSLRQHLKGLTEKSYEALENLRTPEFVLMFIPIEAAFTVAMRTDPGLFDEGFDRRIVMVTPSTLLATLKTVSSLWRQEKRNRHALEIARLGGELYDKIVNFTEALQEVGARLEQATQAHQTAVQRLSTGRGNALRTMEKMRELGVKTRKQLDDGLLEDDGD